MWTTIPTSVKEPTELEGTICGSTGEGECNFVACHFADREDSGTESEVEDESGRDFRWSPALGGLLETLDGRRRSRWALVAVVDRLNTSSQSRLSYRKSPKRMPLDLAKMVLNRFQMSSTLHQRGAIAYEYFFAVVHVPCSED